MYANDRVKRTTKMELYNTKGVIIMSPLAVFAIMLMILLNGYGCAAAAAAVLVKSNTTFRCDGRLDECLIEDDLQFEFLMNPYVSRVLLGEQPGTGNTGNSGSPAFKDCKTGYTSCVAKASGNNNNCVKKNEYDKSCGH
jgi:hypothetical protein